MSKVLVTGAAGFIGSQLAYRLWKDGNAVTLVDNFSYGSEDNLIFPDHDFRDEVYRKDIRDTKTMEDLFREIRFDIVYHIAAITPLPDCQSNPAEATDVNVRGTVIILELARKYGSQKVIFASTSAIYENCDRFPSEEVDTVSPSLIYPSTKYAAEQFCKAFWDSYGFPVVCLRFANVYGPHIDCLRTQPPVMGYIIREFFRGKNPVLHGDGRQKRDFIFVDDLIELALLVRRSETFDIVNVSSQETISINEIAEMIAEEMDCDEIDIEYRETAHYWYRYPELYAGSFPISEDILNREVLKYTCLSNRHAKETYGWEPKTGIREGIARTVDFSCGILKKSAWKG